MNRKVLAGTACLAALGGFAAARMVLPQDAQPEASLPAAFDATQPLAARVAELERVLSEERQARQVLQEELLFVTETLAELRDEAPAPRATVRDEGISARPASRDDTPESMQARRMARLVDAGFAPDRAEWIVQREASLRMELLEARYEAERSGDFAGYREQAEAQRNALREELGPQDYERYLEGTGRPTAITVGSVMDTSPAQRVGLQPGDRITNYGGARIYNMGDLNRAIIEGNAGETVVVQFERDGIPMQVALPRGPVGITAGRSRRGR